MKNWITKETVASTVIGTVSFLFMLHALTGEENSDSDVFWYLGMSLNGLSMALNPEIIFQKITFENFQLKGAVVYGISAFAVITGNFFMIVGVIMWIIEL